MRNFKIFTILLILISIIGCNNSKNSDSQTSDSDSQNITSEQVDNFESQLTADGFFWQSENNTECRSEIIFRKDETATALGQNNNTIENGKWSFDKSTKKLQIAWEKSDQVLTEIVSAKSDWSKISFDKDVYHVCGSDLIRMKLLDNRFDEK